MEKAVTEYLSTLNTPLNGALSKFNADAYSQAHYSWVKQADITKTSSTFRNGFELPATHRVKDLVALIPGDV